MISQKTNRILVNLAKIEMELSKIYSYLSKKEHFRNPVREFWENLAGEEIGHARLFNEIRSKVQADGSIQIEINLEMDQLKSFIDQLKALLKQIVDKDLSESDAYNIGAEIEAALDEANFTKVIKVNDEDITQKIKRLDLDNKKHGMILINYSKGVK